MRHSVSRHLAAAALAAAVLLAGSPSNLQAAGRSAAAAARPEACTSFTAADLAAALRTWWGTFWPTEGCTADPSGSQHCGSNGVAHLLPPRHSRPVRPGEGCTLDPSGNQHCHP
jgi:hypothetical protein